MANTSVSVPNAASHVASQVHEGNTELSCANSSTNPSADKLTIAARRSNAKNGNSRAETKITVAANSEPNVGYFAASRRTANTAKIISQLNLRFLFTLLRDRNAAGRSRPVTATSSESYCLPTSSASHGSLANVYVNTSLPSPLRHCRQNELSTRWKSSSHPAAATPNNSDAATSLEKIRPARSASSEVSFPG